MYQNSSQYKTELTKLVNNECVLIQCLPVCKSVRLPARLYVCYCVRVVQLKSAVHLNLIVMGMSCSYYHTLTSQLPGKAAERHHIHQQRHPCEFSQRAQQPGRRLRPLYQPFRRSLRRRLLPGHHHQMPERHRQRRDRDVTRRVSRVPSGENNDAGSCQGVVQ